MQSEPLLFTWLGREKELLNNRNNINKYLNKNKTISFLIAKFVMITNNFLG